MKVRAAVRAALPVLATAMLCGAWAFTLRPVSLGGPTGYVMVRGVSMNPKYHSYDLVLTKRQSNYRVGDIVAYHVPEGQPGQGIIVIHRIIGGSDRAGWNIKGDNNPMPDDWHPHNADIVGTSWVLLPQMGKLLLFLHAPVPLASLAAGVAAALVLVPASGSRREPDAEDAQEPLAPLPVPAVSGVSLEIRVFLGLATWPLAATRSQHRGSSHEQRIDEVLGADLDDREATLRLFRSLSLPRLPVPVDAVHRVDEGAIAGRTRP